MPYEKKWIVLAAGVVCQTALGGIYAWSTFVPHLMSMYGLSGAQCGLIFGVMIASFSLATIPAGRFLLKAGPRPTAGIGALLFTGGYILASFSRGSFTLLVAGLGVTAGTGIGFAYVCPLTVGMKWFPDSKGFVTGVAVAGLGLGAILLSSIAESLLASMDVLVVLRIAGISLGGVAFTAAMFMSEPPLPPVRNGSVKAAGPVGAHVFSPRFLLICFAMFAGTFAGLLISGNLKPMKLSLGLSEYQATLAITMFAVGNTSGRLVWGRVHDLLGSRKTILLSLGFLFLSILLLSVVTDQAAVLAASALVGFGFGACFVVYASSVVECFGVENLPRLYPICFAGYGLAALLGPAAGGWFADAYGSYAPALFLSAAVVLPAFALVYARFPAVLRKSAVSRPPVSRRIPTGGSMVRDGEVSGL